MAAPRREMAGLEMDAQPAQIVAEQILWARRDDSDRTTTMHILKLSYICHGWMLGIHGEPLVLESAEAWRYGPVIPEVYHRYKSFRGNPIDAVPIDRTRDMNKNQVDMIEAVLDAYREYSAWQLSVITHKPGTPWSMVYNRGNGLGSIIPNSIIKTYYENLARS